MKPAPDTVTRIFYCGISVLVSMSAFFFRYRLRTRATVGKILTPWFAQEARGAVRHVNMLILVSFPAQPNLMDKEGLEEIK